jgi:mannonate dehydratase
MRIDRVEVVVTSPGRNFTTLRVLTDDGLEGLGDATLNGRELAVATYLEQHVAPLLRGRDAGAIEDTWQYLYRAPYWRRGPVTMAAVAAVDQALWDIKAKAAGMPLYQLLGGACRTGLLAYGHAAGLDGPSTLDAVRARLAEGYRAVRVQAAVPGLDHVYGTYPQPSARDADQVVRPVEEDWDSRAYLRHAPALFDAVRAEFGPELPLLHDVHHRLTPIQAARLAVSLEPHDLFWLEDCTPAENHQALRTVRGRSTTPLAIGEVFNTVWDYQNLITEQLIDYVRASATHFGGVTPLRKLVDLAALYQIRSGFHGPTDISPVGFAAQLHLGLAVHNFGIQEYVPQETVVGEVFRTTMSFQDGYLHPGDEPGLGVTLDTAAAARFPYAAAYLPIARLADGTVHDW